MTLPTCCQYHADKLPDGCRQGRNCPARTRRVQEADIRWSREIGYEAADLSHRCSAAPAAYESQSAGRAVLIYAGTVLATALAAVALFINT